MKIRYILFTLFVLLITALIALFFVDLLNNLDSQSLVNANYQNNIVTNNQVSIRDIKNVTSSITSNSNNSTIQPIDNSGTPTSWILPVVFLGGTAFIIVLIGLAYCSGAMDVTTTSDPGTFELAERN